MKKYLRAAVLAALCVLALFSLTACGEDAAKDSGATGATATEPTVQVEELGDGTQTKDLAVDVKGPLQVKFRKITIPPGLGTGKHCHYGNLIAVVKQGTLTHYAPIYPSGVHTYKKGDSIVEGSGYVHEGKNEGDENVVLMVTYITPEGDPPAETELDRCNSR
jgi:quercetin dioxygenase-like cupin family protein